MIPVVDPQGRIKGIVSVDDIVDVVQEEATEDIHKIGGAESRRNLGGILATIGLLRIVLWQVFFSAYGDHYFLVALTVALSLVGVVLWGSLVGSILPFILRSLGFDPASACAPFVATLVDVTGLVIYFTVAAIVLRGTLL